MRKNVIFAAFILLCPACSQANDMTMVGAIYMIPPLLISIIAAIALYFLIKRNPTSSLWSVSLKILAITSGIPAVIMAIISGFYVFGRYWDMAAAYLGVFGVYCLALSFPIRIDAAVKISRGDRGYYKKNILRLLAGAAILIVLYIVGIMSGLI